MIILNQNFHPFIDGAFVTDLNLKKRGFLFSKSEREKAMKWCEKCNSYIAEIKLCKSIGFDYGKCSVCELEQWGYIFK